MLDLSPFRLTVPGCLIAAARYNRPTVIVYGGTIKGGRHKIDCPGMGRKAGDPANIGNVDPVFFAMSDLL
jgi:hypothetical protein